SHPLSTSPHPGSTLFPYTTLFRSNATSNVQAVGSFTGSVSLSCSTDFGGNCTGSTINVSSAAPTPGGLTVSVPSRGERGRRYIEDRKSTRLNSSHQNISYAVFYFA